MDVCSPSASLTVWAGSWLAGRSAPDDVLGALHRWAPRHTLAAGDPETGGRADLPWSSRENAESNAVLGLLKVIRQAMTRGTSKDEPDPTHRGQLRLVLPVPGDVRGLPVGTAFASDAIDAGEGLLVGVPGENGTGIIPRWVDENTVQWAVYTTPIPPPLPVDMSLGEAEYAMREAVRDAADALVQVHTTNTASPDIDPRRLVEAQLAECARHGYPDSIPLRAKRILDTADHVAAILTVAGRAPAAAATSLSAAAQHESLLRPLWDVIRSARLIAVHTVPLTTNER